MRILELESVDTINDGKAYMQDKEGIYPDQHTLIFLKKKHQYGRIHGDQNI